MNNKALIIFLRKPELGKVKTRLAKSIGDEKALLVYHKLVQHTFTISKDLECDIYPFYKPEIPDSCLWNSRNTQIQEGKDLGECMENAFRKLFRKGYKEVIIIGSDCYQLDSSVLNEAFDSLSENEFVFGPAEDGGYYLLGMKNLDIDLFSNMTWSVEGVLAETLKRVENKKVHILKSLNDIDTLEDLQKEGALNDIIKTIHA